MRDLKEIDIELATLQDELNNVHGTPTEVYARIVGYYRAVKNWNKGKRDEFDNRKTFSIELPSESHSTNIQETSSDTFEETHNSVTPTINSTHTYELYVRQTCPNCPPVKDFMSKIDLPGKIIDVDTEQGLTEAASKGVFAAPTVIVYNNDGTEISRAHNVEELAIIFESVAVAQ